METTEGVANFFIDKALHGECDDLSQMKLQKLVYYAHGWHLGLSSHPLFVEPVQAWRYGPVIQSLRREFRDFGKSPITRKARDLVLDGTVLREKEFTLRSPEEVSPLLQKVWDEYHDLSAIQLTNMTHAPGTPWHQIALHYNFEIPLGTTIPNELIREHFRAQALKAAPPMEVLDQVSI